MDITIHPKLLSGEISAIPSKSQAHRLLICSAFADRVTELICPDTNEDIEATAQCLNALGADIQRTSTGYLVKPVEKIPEKAILNCRESGSTLRFMLPIAGALGVKATFQLAGRLPKRPLSPLWEEMERMGCRLSRPTDDTIACNGKLICGNYRIDGGVSSQFITGLTFALCLIPGDCQLEVLGNLQSKPYLDMTMQALSIFGAEIKDGRVPCCYPFTSPGKFTVEGDWSNSAFFLVAKALGCNISVTGLDNASYQGDKEVVPLIAQLKEYSSICAKDIPDLVPILAVLAGANKGADFTDIARLRLKESDRVATVAALLENFGCKTAITENTLTVYPAAFDGCTIDAAGDHRIAMAAAIAATVANGPVHILGAECVKKSYPAFWAEYQKLGGQYEQYIR